MIYGTRPDLVMTATTALKSWKGSASHNAVIINSGMWKKSDWKAIGIGMYNGYACVWFGEEPDTTLVKNEE
jgi:exopolysaccharide biosynthesis protein